MAAIPTLALGACSSSEDSDSTNVDGGGVGGGGGTQGGTGGSGGITTSDGTPCNQASYHQTCSVCCAWPDVTRTLFLGYLDARCRCATGAPCEAACSQNLCAGAEATEACSACETTDACEAEARADCSADPACKPIVDCFDSCAGLPES